MEIITKLETLISDFKNRNDKDLLIVSNEAEKIFSVCTEIERSWSGSYSGYHGSLYYGDFEPPPINRRFSVEWGTINGLPTGWRPRQPDEVTKKVEDYVGENFSIKALEKDSVSYLESVKELRENILDIIETSESLKKNERILLTIDEIKKINFGEPRSIFGKYINDNIPKTRVTRDSEALMEGVYIPSQLYCKGVAFEAKEIVENTNTIIKFTRRLIKQLYDSKEIIKGKQNIMEIKFENLHKDILSKCSKLYNDGSYAEAVEKGFKVVRDRLRELTNYEKGSEAFGKGKLHIKGAVAEHVDFDFNEAVKFLTMAIDFFRNEKSHSSDANIDDPIRAYEYLRLSSLAMHLLDNAEIKK